MTESVEQLRRLKNTIMGAGHRLSLLAGSSELEPAARSELRGISSELNEVVRRLERLLIVAREEG